VSVGQPSSRNLKKIVSSFLLCGLLSLAVAGTAYADVNNFTITRFSADETLPRGCAYPFGPVAEPGEYWLATKRCGKRHASTQWCFHGGGFSGGGGGGGGW
jgi:hypothetical protein